MTSNHEIAGGKEATGRDSDKFMLRMPEGLREKVKDLAETERRSMNAQIVKFIELGLKLAA